MANSVTIIIRIFTFLTVLMLFLFHFADFALKCDDKGFGEQRCTHAWFNNQFRLSSDYKTKQTFARQWYRDALGVTVFVVNLLLIFFSLIFILGAFTEIVTGSAMCILKFSFVIVMFLFAIGVVVCRGLTNTPIVFAGLGAFLCDTLVFVD
ncbi:hypothetical protein L596_006875 [Steinernema carpocapsae]|uniref:Uncharacterized protein n=1 Tax=Steinernema carpocapsae TaxID=34508 RepID=A0A4U5P7X0_STECR|nr:hypothetical protein L596_006875 [Steinernema carpocapsae]